MTALYTAATWQWADLPRAELFATPLGARVFWWTNAVMWLATRFRPGLPSLPHSLLRRHLAIDALLRTSGSRSVLELAAGLSRRGACFTDDPACHCTELDVPQIVGFKRELLQRSASGREVLARSNYRLVGGDALTTPLSELVGGEGPLFVIAEGLAMYLQAPERRRFARHVAELLATHPAGGAFVFDLTPTDELPRAGLVGRALGWLMARFTSGQTFTATPLTRTALVTELETAGFGFVRAMDPVAPDAAVHAHPPSRRTQVVLFLCAPSAPRWLP